MVVGLPGFVGLFKLDSVVTVVFRQSLREFIQQHRHGEEGAVALDQPHPVTVVTDDELLGRFFCAFFGHGLLSICCCLHWFEVGANRLHPKHLWTHVPQTPQD